MRKQIALPAVMYIYLGKASRNGVDSYCKIILKGYHIFNMLESHTILILIQNVV